MAYLVPSEFVAKMVDAGESKVFMSVRDTLIRAFMAGALLALGAVFAVSITVQTGNPLIGAMLCRRENGFVGPTRGPTSGAQVSIRSCASLCSGASKRAFSSV
jgi:hypothetical protein